jgi:ATP-dependent protease ClpP protease subunit
MDRDRFFKADEAAKYGLIDRVIEEREIEPRRTGFAAQNGG